MIFQNISRLNPILPSNPRNSEPRENLVDDAIHSKSVPADGVIENKSPTI